MTEKEFTDAFLKLMCTQRAQQLAAVLCQPPAAMEIVDDLEGETFFEDDSKFAEDGSIISGVVMSEAERKVHDTYFSDTTMLRLEGDMAYYKWVMEMIRQRMPMHENKVYALMRDQKTRPYMEIIVAVCAILKAFPDNAKELIDTYVKNNQVYAPFWDGAMPYVRYLLP